MLTVFSTKHRLHHGSELKDGTLSPSFENPQRADTVLARVQSTRLGEVIGEKEFDRSCYVAAHSERYVAFLENAWGEWAATGKTHDALPLIWPVRDLAIDREPGFIDGKLGFYAMDAGAPITSGTWEAVRGSANVALTAVDTVIDGGNSAFALCRPPGHHAAREYMGGYCYLNNAAIAAERCRSRGAQRVAVLDVDFHHGNGTQNIFYDRPDVFFASIHGDPHVSYPYFSGYANEQGAGPGQGFNANYPLARGTTWDRYAEALQHALQRIAAHQPDFLVVSLGVDTFEHDPISHFRLTSSDFIRMGERIAGIRVPTLFVMEGGYMVEEIGINAVNTLQGFENAYWKKQGLVMKTRIGDNNEDNATLHQAPGHLKRTLENRHIQLISIGGAIGTGLFMGSGKVIAMSGTSIVLVYAIIGFFLYFVMRAMGELLLSDLQFKSFADIVAHYLGPRAGFVLSWSYWLSWSVAVVGDVVVVAGFFQYWYPDVPTWMCAFFTMGLLLCLNVLAVRIFGEIEFWFAIVKLLAIVLLIITAFVMIATSFTSPSGVVASVAHMVEKGSMLPHGISGFFAGFQIAIFSFAGTELIGTTAAEAKDPERTLPKAINTIPLRILLFYVLSLVCIISVVSWAEVPANRSPFVELFLLAGFPAAAGMINFVVLTSAASSGNSGVYSGCRMLFGLAERGIAPATFGRLSAMGVPIYSLLFSGICMMAGLGLLFVIPEVMTVFTLISTVSAILVIFTWSMILAAYIAYRRKNPAAHQRSRFKLPGGVATAALTLAFLFFVLTLLAFKPDTRVALFAMPLWFVFLLVMYQRRRLPQATAATLTS